MFIIGGIQKTTLTDFPQKIAAIVFTQGCNFRCGYCHNPELLEFNKTNFEVREFLEFLKTGQGKLDGVVITGGEPTLQNGLYDFIKNIKDLNFEVKLDTNGTNPKILEKLINDNMLDYIAMDIKAPLKKYPEITGVDVNIKDIQKSIKIIMNSGIDYEFRTTVVKSMLTIDDIIDIGKMLKGAKRYYLQKFVSTKIYNTDLNNAETYTNEEFTNICEDLKNFIQQVNYR